MLNNYKLIDDINTSDKERGIRIQRALIQNNHDKNRREESVGVGVYYTLGRLFIKLYWNSGIGFD